MEGFRSFEKPWTPLPWWIPGEQDPDTMEWLRLGQVGFMADLTINYVANGNFIGNLVTAYAVAQWGVPGDFGPATGCIVQQSLADSSTPLIAWGYENDLFRSFCGYDVQVDLPPPAQVVVASTREQLSTLRLNPWRAGQEIILNVQFFTGNG